MVTTTGEKAQGEGCHNDTTTRMTPMITATQDRLQERSMDKRTTTSSDYIIRLTDGLLRCGTKIIICFSQFQSFSFASVEVMTEQCAPFFPISVFQKRGHKNRHKKIKHLLQKSSGLRPCETLVVSRNALFVFHSFAISETCLIFVKNRHPSKKNLFYSAF